MTNYRSLTVVLVMMASGISLLSEAEPPTYHRDVEPILQENCQVCHRPSGNNVMGMVAPMALTSYPEVRPWAKAIRRQVETRAMPPWSAAPEFHGVFANERTLTDDEIATIVNWVETGAARGNPKDAPDPASFPQGDGYVMGEPDLVVRFEEPYYVRDEVEDHYHMEYVRIPDQDLPQDRWIQSMEFKPGSEAVHHIVIYSDSYRESLGFGQGMLGGMGPGTDGTYFPDGFGRLLEAGSTLMFNMHYHKESGPGTGVWDRSEIAFKFHDAPVKYEVNWGAVGTHGISIPPETKDHEIAAWESFPRDTLILALFPHMHLRGQAARYVAHYPDGREEVLLHVPHYDFDWQTNYIFKEPKRIPAGTRIEVTMWYDNSAERAAEANFDPTRTVYWGEETTDEMMYGWLDYAEAEPLISGADD